jgi:hypothetical protein
MLTFDTLLLILQHGEFGFDVRDFVLERNELVLAVLKLIKFLLEGSNECVFLEILGFAV